MPDTTLVGGDGPVKLRDRIGKPLVGWIELVLASVAVLWAASPFFRRFAAAK